MDLLPRFPKGPLPKVGIVGCGGIVRGPHLSAYLEHDVPLAGVFDPSAEAISLVRELVPRIHVYGSLEELLADPEVVIIDAATHVGPRIEIIRRSLEAGKHVLSQKPLAGDVPTARSLIATAARSGRRLAVNQNGRWSPPWRKASSLIEQGVIGDIVDISHVFDTSLQWIEGSAFDSLPHWLIWDYAVHWIDITRCWLGDQEIEWVAADEIRLPHQPPAVRSALGANIEIRARSGASAFIRAVGMAQKGTGHPFFIHGTLGTLRGNTLIEDSLELKTGDSVQPQPLEGSWFPGGFAGTMGELMCAIAENREPSNSANHNLRSLQITLAACRSAEQEGRKVKLEEMG